MHNNLIKTSKFLSLVLRHKAQEINIQLDGQGWVDTKILLHAAKQAGFVLDRKSLDEVVSRNDKQRFAFNPDKTRICANQGHSVRVDLGLPSRIPPPVLYHGTANHLIGSIMREGLCKKERQHVHLSPDIETAVKVGRRHGKAFVLKIDSAAMQEAGDLFYQSANRVWLTDKVPANFLKPQEG